MFSPIKVVPWYFSPTSEECTTTNAHLNTKKGLSVWRAGHQTFRSEYSLTTFFILSLLVHADTTARWRIKGYIYKNFQVILLYDNPVFMKQHTHIHTYLCTQPFLQYERNTSPVSCQLLAPSGCGVALVRCIAYLCTGIMLSVSVSPFPSGRLRSFIVL